MSMCVYVYGVCVHLYMCVCVCVCYVCTYVCVCLYVCVSLYVCMCSRVETGLDFPGHILSGSSGSDLVYKLSGSDPDAALDHVR